MESVTEPSPAGHTPEFHGIVRLDAEARAVYAEAAGIARIMPHAVVVPLTTDDVVAVVHWAHTTQASLIPRGSGTSMAGGSVGEDVMVDLSRLRQHGEVDTVAQRIWVEPGVLRNDVDALAGAHGLMFPVDPSSGAFCTIGGMVSTNAAGAHTLRYGAMRRWVTALECVFEDGTRAIVRRGAPPPPDVPALARLAAQCDELREILENTPDAHPRVRKDSSGYDVRAYAERDELIDLLIGSEGTLAMFTGIELALIPRPMATASILAAFASLDDAVRAAVAAREAGASACELLDRTFLEFARGTGPMADALPSDTEAVLLTEVEGEQKTALRPVIDALDECFTAAHASQVKVAFDAKTQHALWELRHAASPTLARLDPSLKSMQFIEDGCVPPENLGDYVRGVREVFARYGIRGAIFGHAGDAHMHVNPLIDVRDPEWRTKVESILGDVVTLTVQLEGTLTGEHGDGRLRTPFLSSIWPPAMRKAFFLVKNAMDPHNIFNPGVKVPLFGQSPIKDIKYDPSLPALPPEAQRALKEIEKTRCYAKFRLDMLGTP